ncbi:DNA alkylation repair protein [Angustibacter luteus]|uniref:DNA alkylation repair protein n=1 Tax=Angustibacter luteus TaxID=658456 RepID=A0ABW1JJA3_9ACTN
MGALPTAGAVVDELQSLASADELAKVRRRLDPAEPAIGVRMRSVFDVAKAATAMPLDEWERLVVEPTYEARMVAFSILDFQARKDVGSRVLCSTYLGHHDRITTWDMVDRAAPRVVGAALAAGPYDVLHELAGSVEPLRRRSAMTAPLWFTRHGSPADLAAGFDVATILCTDAEPSVHKAAGIFLAHAGQRDPAALSRFLEQHSAVMPAAGRRLATRKVTG